MKAIYVIAASLVASSAVLASYGVSGQVINTRLGITIWLNSELEPASPDWEVATKFGMMSLPNGQPGMLRFSVNAKTHEYRGYEMHIAESDTAGTYAITFVPLTATPRSLGLDNAIAWRFMGMSGRS